MSVNDHKPQQKEKKRKQERVRKDINDEAGEEHGRQPTISCN